MARKTTIVRRAAGAAARLLWPACCAGCGTYVCETKAFCDRCGVGVLPFSGACPGCALPLGEAGETDGGRCPGCRTRPFPFARAEAAVLYGGPIAEAVVRFKHGGRRDLGARLALLLAPALGRAIDGAGTAACEAGASDVRALRAAPVPLAEPKLRARGFNQSLVLLLAARRLLGSGVAVDRDLLRRVRDAGELGRSGPAERRRRVAGAFAVAPGRDVRGGRFLLVDDVMTTGATLSECARTLVDAGAASVEVLALARAE